MKRVIIDLDGTLTVDEPADYSEKRPRADVIEKLRQLRAEGFEIVVHTARNMRTYSGSIGKINVHTLPTIIAWLDRHRVPYDEIIVGKPWCGTDGFYVDDRALRPSEFASLSIGQMTALVEREQALARDRQRSAGVLP